MIKYEDVCVLDEEITDTRIKLENQILDLCELTRTAVESKTDEARMRVLLGILKKADNELLEFEKRIRMMAK